MDVLWRFCLQDLQGHSGVSYRCRGHHCWQSERVFELGLAVGLGKKTILIHDECAAENRIPSDLLAWEYVPYVGSAPSDKEWLQHFGVVFDGIRKREVA